eukprot:TRINITY_DN56372_c0_g1_i1.p1 TRINITY_DN56372_c0_g1~~TRINITY_DN56372_c0_g1_i1.p1  ORF type:complete len:352 (-),score=83.06 TRINITY_DN56372_c0_g1_i1:271-1326(-)
MGAAQQSCCDSKYSQEFEETNSVPRFAVKNVGASHIIVDCGSGATRVEKYSMRSDGLIQLDFSERIDVPVAEVLAEGEESKLAFLAEVAKFARPATASREVPVLLGGTAGVREKMDVGTVTLADVANFQSLVKAQLGTAEFRIIPGEAEAGYELAAARYCVGAMPNGARVSASNVGLLSCGGMSSQMVHGDPPKCRSWNTKVKQGNAWQLEFGVQAGLQMYDEYVASILAPELERGERLKGTFVGIEMLGSLGISAGIAGKLLPATDVIAALRICLEKFRQKAAATAAEEIATWGWKNVVEGSQATLALRTLALLDSQDSHVMLCRFFDLGLEHVLKPAWTLGLCASELFQ